MYEVDLVLMAVGPFDDLQQPSLSLRQQGDFRLRLRSTLRRRAPGLLGSFPRNGPSGQDHRNVTGPISFLPHERQQHGGETR